MAIKIRPLHDRVIVKRTEEVEKTKAGIIIPDTAKEKPQEGKVVAVGPGRLEEGKVIPLDVKAGDEILFGKYSGTEINLNGEEHLILREDDISEHDKLESIENFLKTILRRDACHKYCSRIDENTPESGFRMEFLSNPFLPKWCTRDTRVNNTAAA